MNYHDRYSIFGDTYKGVPNPMVPHKHPYPTRYHGPVFKYPTPGWQYNVSPYARAPFDGMDGAFGVYDCRWGAGPDGTQQFLCKDWPDQAKPAPKKAAASKTTYDCRWGAAADGTQQFLCKEWPAEAAQPSGGQSPPRPSSPPPSSPPIAPPPEEKSKATMFPGIPDEAVWIGGAAIALLGVALIAKSRKASR